MANTLYGIALVMCILPAAVLSSCPALCKCEKRQFESLIVSCRGLDRESLRTLDNGIPNDTGQL